MRSKRILFYLTHQMERLTDLLINCVAQSKHLEREPLVLRGWTNFQSVVFSLLRQKFDFITAS